MSNRIMRCKLQLHDVTTTIANSNGKPFHAGAKVRMGAVWEGSRDKQLASENAIFGEATPFAEFVATIRNQAVLDSLVPGKCYYVDFTEVPDPA